MSWSIEEHIGEGRPWPEQVVVYRGETDESLTYARRSLSDVNQMVELMDTLAAENAKLRELATHALRLLREICAHYDNELMRGEPCIDCCNYGSSDCPKLMAKVHGVEGIEVDG